MTIGEIADRRIALWYKNNMGGLTSEEVEEYRRLRRRVSAYIKRKWPENWEDVKALARKRRIKFNKVS